MGKSTDVEKSRHAFARVGSRTGEAGAAAF